MKLAKNSEKLAKNSVKSRHFALHQVVPVKFMTMRTAVVQPRILSKKNNFHLRINGGTQERSFNFVKIFFVYVIVKNVKQW